MQMTTSRAHRPVNPLRTCGAGQGRRGHDPIPNANTADARADRGCQYRAQEAQEEGRPQGYRHARGAKTHKSVRDDERSQGEETGQVQAEQLERPDAEPDEGNSGDLRTHDFNDEQAAANYLRPSTPATPRFRPPTSGPSRP